MNRAQRRQLARQHGWHGSKARKGVSMAEALAKAVEAQTVEEQREYVEKIQNAARATRDMGLVIPGQ